MKAHEARKKMTALKIRNNMKESKAHTKIRARKARKK